jgi:teichuronic acid biosynthesis glycosyltransferase TuaC
MRILIIASYFPTPQQPTAGIWALEQAKALQSLNNEVVVVSPKPKIPRILGLTKKLKCYSQTPEKKEISGITIYYPKCFYYPARFIRKSIYIFFPIFALIPLWLGTKGLFLKLNKNKQFDIIHCHHPLMEGWLALKLKRKLGLPFIVTEHSITAVKYSKKSFLRKRLYNKIVEKSDAIITVSNRIAQEMKVFLNNREINIIRNGIDLKKIDQEQPLRPKSLKNKKIILSVGALSERKGQQYLIQAVYNLKKKIPNIRCFIIGSGKREKYLKKLVKRNNLRKYVTFLGKLPHKEVLKYMSWCNIFALPSWDEPFATVYPEAMSYGKPIIACRGEGTDDIIKNGKNGMLVKKQNVNSLTKAIEKLLKNDKFSNNIGKRGKRLTKEILTWQSNAKQVNKLFNSILKK